MGSILARYPEVAAYFTAVTIVCYWLTYGAMLMFPDIRLRWSWRLAGMAIAILASPLVAGFLFDSVREAFFADVDWRFYGTGFGASVIGLLIAWQIQRARDDADKPKPRNAYAARPTADTAPRPQTDSVANDDEWDTLAEYDLDIREAIKVVAPCGDEALQELRRVFSVIGDRTQMPRIASEIAQKSWKTELTLEQIHAKRTEYDITRNLSGKFVYKEYLFDTLEDAIEYADRASQGAVV